MAVVVLYDRTAMSALSDILSSRVKAEVFRLLFGDPGCALHLREIARQSGLAVGTVRQELKRQVQLGLLEECLRGNRTFYSANPGHPIRGEITCIVRKLCPKPISETPKRGGAGKPGAGTRLAKGSSLPVSPSAEPGNDWEMPVTLL